METIDNVLIVEDEDEWCSIYERAARRQGVTTVRVAKSLAQAQPLLDAMTFGVAFVDIGLDVDDDRNVDGLRVMERIRALGDQTSIIVITGRSGRDVLPITRDAIIKYGAFDTVGKVPIEPTTIAELLARGLASYRDSIAGARPRIHQVLRGESSGWDWDDQILRATEIRGGVDRLYTFLDKLFARYLPVVAREGRNHVRLDTATLVAHGEYWSRAIGAAVVVCFGKSEQVDKLIADVRAGGEFLDQYRVGELLHESSAGTVRGAVFSLPDEGRGGYQTAV